MGMLTMTPNPSKAVVAVTLYPVKAASTESENSKLGKSPATQSELFSSKLDPKLFLHQSFSTPFAHHRRTPRRYQRVAKCCASH
jgi:hypothetical protein